MSRTGTPGTPGTPDPFGRADRGARRSDRSERARPWRVGSRSSPAAPGGPPLRLRDLVTEPFDAQAMARFVELAPAVTFATSWQGYDRSQVDSFRADIEIELRMSWEQAARRRRGDRAGGLEAPGSVRLGGSSVRDMRFSKVLRGYDPVEVDTYLDCAAAVLTYLHAH